MLKFLVASLGLLWIGSAAAQPQPQGGAADVLSGGCGTAGYPTGMQPVTQDSTGKVCVNATVTATATITGFTPASVGTPIAVTTGGVTGTLPAGTVVVVSNVGSTNDAYCALGSSSTTAQQDIPPKSWFAFTVGVATQLTCITSTSTTTVNMVGGSGIPTGSGGGGGGGGSSSNASVSATGSAVPGSATYIGILSGGNLSGWTGAITAASLPLPTGAATAAKQPALGTAGSASTDVLTIQGIASMTPLLAAESGTWNITNISGTVSLPTGAATAANQVTTPATGNGTTNSSTQRVTISSDSTGIVAATTTASATTPAAGTAHIIATGGTALTFVTGPVKGCYIVNPLLASDQGISTAEPLFLNPVTTATTTGNSSTVAVQPGQQWTCPAGMTTNVSAVAATTAHAAVVVVW